MFTKVKRVPAMTELQPQQLQDERQDHEVTVEVFSPRQTQSKQFTWPVDWTVRIAAKQAADVFGYQGGDPTLGRGDIVFDRNKTLHDEHVHQHEHLELLDVGGGV